MPFVIQGWECFLAGLESMVEVNPLLDVGSLLQLDEAIFYGFGESVLQYLLVPFLCVTLDVLSCRGNSMRVGSFDTSVVFTTVVPGRLCISGDFDVASGEPLDNGR